MNKVIVIPTGRFMEQLSDDIIISHIFPRLSIEDGANLVASCPTIFEPLYKKSMAAKQALALDQIFTRAKEMQLSKELLKKTSFTLQLNDDQHIEIKISKKATLISMAATLSQKHISWNKLGKPARIAYNRMYRLEFPVDFSYLNKTLSFASVHFYKKGVTSLDSIYDLIATVVALGISTAPSLDNIQIFSPNNSDHGKSVLALPLFLHR